jgi:hypothetical protein
MLKKKLCGLNRVAISDNDADAEKIFPEATKAADLVSLPNKQVVANLGRDPNAVLAWSADSEW